MAGPRADLYSLGVVTYQLLSGRLPYEAASLAELALKQQRELPTPLVQLSPEVPVELAEAVGIAISIDPEDRPVDAAELGEMLRDGAKGISPYEDAPTRPVTAQTRALPRRGPDTSRRTAPTPRGAPASPSRARHRRHPRHRRTAAQRQHPASGARGPASGRI